MSKYSTALYCELKKIRASKVFLPTLLVLLMAPLFGALFIVILRSPSTGGNEFLRLKAAATGFSPDWLSFLNLIAQAVGVGGVIVFGFMASWLFGREYSDRTIGDLLVLPIGRGTIVLAKMTALLIWSLLASILVILVGVLTAFLLRVPGWSSSLIFYSLGKIFLTALMAASLSPLVAFMASVGRGYLAPLGFVILSVVIAQIMGALGLGIYFPWAIPALFSGLGAGEEVGIISVLILLFTATAGTVATWLWWKYADHSL